MATIEEYNERYLPGLVKALRSVPCAGLIGAGTSIAAGYPGWGDFLDALEVPLGGIWPEARLDQVRQQDPLIRVDTMVEALGDEYPQIFRATFQPRGDGSATPEWIRLIFDLDLRLLLTTNYTIELEQAARFHPSTPLGEHPKRVRWYIAAELRTALRQTGEVQQLLHLHGRWDDSPEQLWDEHELPWSQVVLGEKSYRYAYLHPGAAAKALEVIAGIHTLLVVGASLQDEDVKAVLRAVGAEAGGGAPPHYVILGLRPGEDPDIAAVEPLERFGCRAVFYPAVASGDGGEDHGGLEVLLRGLCAAVAPAGHTVGVAAPVGEPLPVMTEEFPPRARIVHPLPVAAYFQPRPPYIAALRDFVRRDHGGVFALRGIGGTGKTALLHHIQDDAIAATDGMVVWSFNDHPDAASFLRSVASYIRREEVPEDWREAKAFTEIRTNCAPEDRWLFVMDGLESIQADQPDDAAVHGSLASNVLRQFLLWLATAPVAARALLTTRLPLPYVTAGADMERFEMLGLGSLTRPQARSLLRQRGVTGTDVELDDMLDHYGAHALTVNQLGGVLTEYLGGEARRFRELGEGPLARFEAGHTHVKLNRVVASYQGYLEPGVRDTLQRVAIFPRPVTTDLLRSVFLDPSRTEHSGTLTGKTEADLQGYLERLVELRFVSPETTAQGTAYAMNSALRDAVLSDLGEDRVGYAQAAQDSMLERAPGTKPTNPADLDYIEDLIGLCIDTDNLDQAFDLYWYRLGADDHHLDSVPDGYARGARITRRLIYATAHHPTFPRRDHFLLVGELALHLHDSGRLTEALPHYQAEASPDRWADEPRQLSRALENYADALIPAGQLRHAADRAKEAGADATLGLALGLRGHMGPAFDAFTSALRDQYLRSGRDQVLSSGPGFDLQTLLLRAGHADEGLTLATAALTIHERNGWVKDIAGSQLVQAEAHRQLGHHPDHCQAVLDAAKQWALTVGHYQTQLWFYLIAARLHHDRGHHPAAIEEAQTGLRAAHVGGWRIHEIDLHNTLAAAQLANSQPAQALDQANQALSLSADPDCDYHWGQRDAHRNLAHIHQAAGDHAGAQRHQIRADELGAQAEITDEMIAPQLEVRIDELREQEELDSIRPPIDGYQVMAHLDIDPGPLVGEAMDMLLEHRLDQGPYSEDEAFRLLTEWWAARSG